MHKFSCVFVLILLSLVTHTDNSNLLGVYSPQVSWESYYNFLLFQFTVILHSFQRVHSMPLVLLVCRVCVCVLFESYGFLCL